MTANDLPKGVAAASRAVTRRKLFASFRDAPLLDRLHVRIRWIICPFRAIAAEIPDGDVLEVGCGHGLFSIYLALVSKNKHVSGFDVDARKVGIARRAGERVAESGARVRFLHVENGRLPTGEWNGVVVVDVLYLLESERQERLVRECASRLEPRGTLVIKEVARHPSWKFRITAIEEWIAVRVLSLTRGDHLNFAAPEAIASWMEAEGLAVRQRSLAKRHIHPHHLVIGTKKP